MSESAYVSSLIQGDINHFKSVVCGYIDEFFKSHDYPKSLDMSYITGLISDVHVHLELLLGILKESFDDYSGKVSSSKKERKIK